MQISKTYLPNCSEKNIFYKLFFWIEYKKYSVGGQTKLYNKGHNCICIHLLLKLHHQVQKFTLHTRM
jgi:hypothetical protein